MDNPENLEATRSVASNRPPSPLASGHLFVFHDARAFRFELPERGLLLIGRGAEADLLLDDPSVSRRHARLEIEAGEIRVADLESRNGVLVNGEAIGASRALSTGDVIAIGDVSLVVHAPSPVRRAAAIEDPVRLRERLDAEVERSVAGERPLAVLALLVPTQIPRAELVTAVCEHLRLMDVVGWMGAGELVVALPETADEAQALVAARLLTAVAKRAPEVRLGMARCPADHTDAESLCAVARAAAAAASPGGMREASSLPTEIELGKHTVIVADPAMLRIYDLLRRLAARDLPVLITGATGTGKEYAAWSVHHWSRRAAGPFVAINCAAIAHSLLESELFGHEKGVFSGAIGARAGLFEAASGGTLFLDEVGELHPDAQAKLLRVLETKRVLRVGGTVERTADVRIVAATLRRLEDDVKDGRFRQDLYFRLGAASVTLPPLRDRPREIGLLARRFLSEACAKAGRPPLSLSAATVALLARYHWPGNVRELQKAMENVEALLPDGETVEPWHLHSRITEAVGAAMPEAGAAAGGTVVASPAPRPMRPLAEELRAIERERMAEALRACGNVKTRAADLLGVPIRTFSLRCKQYGL